ncbi:hypothetical protein DFH06DRAFT_1093434 [Mycena polygramma]|nr:hypothetical protein DFH06DRAFT_1093434 [Mycena polygramma]
MVQALPLDKLGIISSFIEAILYGFSVLMFIATIWILVVRKANGRINYPMVVVASLLLIVSSLHIGCDVWRIYDGFITFRDSYPGGTAAWFSNLREPSFIVKSIIYSVQTALGDGVVIYRCYMVRRSVRAIVLPVMLWLAFCASAIGAIYQVDAAWEPTAPGTPGWLQAFYATTFACNLVASGILAYRLWTIDKNVQNLRLGNSLVRPALATIIDAGAIYSATLVVAIINFALKSNAQFILLDITVPIISIVFYMVVIRVALANAPGDVVSAFQSRRPAPPRRDTFSMHVHIEQLTEVDQDLPSKVNDAEMSQQDGI